MSAHGKSAWIGLAHIVAGPASELREGSRAFVNVVAFAEHGDEFVERAAAQIKCKGFQLLEFEDVSTLIGPVRRDILRAREHARSNGRPAFATFHTYSDIDD